MSVSQSEAKKRVPIPLSARLDRKLLGYSVAATATGVGLLALALPGQAQIVYTAANQMIPRGGSLALDLNHDGITDFTITNSVSYGCLGDSCVLQQLAITPSTPNGVMEISPPFAYAAPMLARVGPVAQFSPSWAKMDRCKATRTSQYSSGSWNGAGSHYLGLAFSIDGQTHYGWARIRSSVRGKCGSYVVLTGYAYQTIPGEPIRAGETVNHKVSATDRMPSTLGVLAAGSVALEAWRRR